MLDAADSEPVPASLARCCPRSFRSASVARSGQDDGEEIGCGDLEPSEVLPLRERCSLWSGLRSLDEETRSRYRLRWREAVRGPSAPRALLASVTMTEIWIHTRTYPSSEIDAPISLSLFAGLVLGNCPAVDNPTSVISSEARDRIRSNRFAEIFRLQQLPLRMRINLDAETWNRYRLRLREAVRDPSAPVASLPSVRMTIKATWNRYRLRLREAVRDPSAPVASLPSVRMTLGVALLSSVRMTELSRCSLRSG